MSQQASRSSSKLPRHSRCLEASSSQVLDRPSKVLGFLEDVYVRDMVAKRVSICRQQDAIADMPQKSKSMVVKTDRGESRQIYAPDSYGAGAVSQRCDSRVYWRQAGRQLGSGYGVGDGQWFCSKAVHDQKAFCFLKIGD